MATLIYVVMGLAVIIHGLYDGYLRGLVAGEIRESKKNSKLFR